MKHEGSGPLISIHSSTRRADSVFVGHILIDYSECIGCSVCSSVCIRGNIRMESGRPVETGEGMGCFDCGHCFATCPMGAIALTFLDGFGSRGFDPVEHPIPGDAMMDFLERRRSCRWFTGDPVTEEEFEALFRAASCSPSANNIRDVEFAVVGDRLMPFMSHISEIMAPRASELPRFRQLRCFLDDLSHTGNNPLLWEGRQIILAFSRSREDAIIAMGRVEMMAYAMGLGGFFSHWIMMVDDQDHDGLMEFFPEIPADKRMCCAFIIGHPRICFRRTVPRKAPTVHMM